ncbi:nuclear transport factor 2 family protein, partial [Actinomadura adrarensis]
MSDTNDLVQRYLGVWNETDGATRQAMLEEVFAEDAVYTDPLVSVRGRAGLDATISAVQAQFGGLVFSLGGTVDAHHDIARFTWHLG